MNFIKKNWKKALFAILIISLFIPITVKTFSLFNEEPLGGVTISAEKPVLNDSTWFNGSFQKDQEKYINENIGLRSTLIRINNQLDFSLYTKTSSEKVVIGKENYLFEDSYILATTGKDYVGDEKIIKLTNQAKQCQAILNEMSIKMLFVFAPGKATYFSEYIPDEYLDGPEIIKTNYSMLISHCYESGINYIDFNSWFLRMKDTTSYPLFPKAGIHWSYYGMFLCADSLIKKVEKDIGQDIPEIKMTNLEISEEQRHTEYDLGRLMNLYYPIKTYPLAYPTIAYETKEKYKPKVLVIGDSFYWNLYYSGIPSNVFNSLDYYYYNSKYYNDGTDKPKAEIKNLNYLEEISKYEYVIILQTDGGLNNFGFGFFNKIINASNIGEVNPELEQMIIKIKNDPEWMIQIEVKAKEREISVDEMILLDANYMLELDNKNSVQN